MGDLAGVAALGFAFWALGRFLLARLPVRVGPVIPALPMLAERSTGTRVLSAVGPRRVALALELGSAIPCTCSSTSA